jgi:hypothetical protein
MPTITWAVLALCGAFFIFLALRAVLHKSGPKRPAVRGSRPARTGNWEQVDSQRRNAR